MKEQHRPFTAVTPVRIPLGLLSALCRANQLQQGIFSLSLSTQRYFFAWKDGVLIGTFNALEEAMEFLVWREKLSSRDDVLVFLESL
jgi:hypothetical protein